MHTNTSYTAVALQSKPVENIEGDLYTACMSVVDQSTPLSTYSHRVISIRHILLQIFSNCYIIILWMDGCNIDTHQNLEKQVFRVKKLVGRRGAPELELLAVVIVLFAPILHESLTNSNFVTNTI